MLLARSTPAGACRALRRTPPAAVFSTARIGTSSRRGGLIARAEEQPSTSQTEQAPTQAKEEVPIWVRRERERELQAGQSSGLPWPLYLVFSFFTLTAAIGSIFEFANKNAIFGVLPPTNPLWAPILGFFVLSGIPMGGFLFFKGVKEANEAAERQDKIDGYIE